MTRDDRLRIAVFIDFDNIEIGVKNTLGASFDAGLVLEALKERGDVVSKTAYSDWQRAGGYSRTLTQHAIKMVQRNLTPGGDKNGADINLALDALEMAFTHPHINAFVIVGGDSDFISLVEKLKQYDKKVFVVGGRQFTSVDHAAQLPRVHRLREPRRAPSARPPAGGAASAGSRRRRVERAPIEQAIPLVTRALKVLSEREVSPQLGLLKSTLLQLDSTFSERSYGAGSFRDFVEKLANARRGPRSAGQGRTGSSGRPTASPADAASELSRRRASRDVRRPSTPTAMTVTLAVDRGPPALGTGRARRPTACASSERSWRRAVRRWPMYLRNVKQLLRAGQPHVRRARVRLWAISSICCARRRGKGSCASSAIARASFAYSRARTGRRSGSGRRGAAASPARFASRARVAGRATSAMSRPIPRSPTARRRAAASRRVSPGRARTPVPSEAVARARRRIAGRESRHLQRHGRDSTGGTSWNLETLALQGEPEVREFVATPITHETRARFSPDGAFVAYASNDFGRYEVGSVRAFVQNSARALISQSSGRRPIWSHDGTRIFYFDNRQLMSASIAKQPSSSRHVAVKTV